MEPSIHRGYGALRIGRWSQSNADYFLTGCLNRPLTGLATPPLTDLVRARLHELETQGYWRLRTYVLMPDHFHLLVTLGSNDELSEVVRRFKGSLTPALRRQGLAWQKSFYDRRLRTDADVFPVFLYVFLNPYQARLVANDAKWPLYYCAPEDWTWFGELTNESVPFPEWLK
jgi:putative transposase